MVGPGSIGHGRGGWQDTSFIDPSLILRITKRDRTFRRVLLRSILFLIFQEGRFKRLLEFLKTSRIVQLLDPNFGTSRSALNEQLSFIPIGTDGLKRVGIRDRLLKVHKEYHRRLVIKTQTLVKRVVFEPAASVKEAVPRAVGVEVVEGLRIYEAAGGAPLANQDSKFYFAREEIILAGGAFNSPQLLMLSGIGDKSALETAKVAGLRDAGGRLVSGDPYVHLPGVGQNLQDRYEISVISKVDGEEFKTLAGVEFDPDKPSDPALQRWRDEKKELYSTNGGALSFFYTSENQKRNTPTSQPLDPDLFIFGAPAAFRGYYRGWSKELLFETKGSGVQQRNLWSWLILKAYTQNNAGTVTLRDNDPLHVPDICFNSFPPGSAGDVDALREGLGFVRRMNEKIEPFTEIQPGKFDRGGQPVDLDKWIQDEAWGHHACGTCKIGSAPWQKNTDAVKDGAVVDSKFRVHGVSGLRVADASVFPKIPGYFIVTPIFMVGEKAADELLATRVHDRYPAHLEQLEATAVHARRQKVEGKEPDPLWVDNKLPDDSVGLALSGGGIRSATLCLGVLQALAQRGRLKAIDFLATVSGGGYTGSFLGRLFTRMAHVSQPAQRVEEIVGNINSEQNRWIRTHANYISAAGRSDREVNTGVIWRNLLGAHLCLAAMFIGLFALARFLADETFLGSWEIQLFGMPLSPWWWTPALVFVFGVYPAWLAFWFAPKPGAGAAHPLFGLMLWLVMLGAAVAALRVQKVELLAAIAITSLLTAWFWQELARIGAVKDDDPEAIKHRGSVVRNRLTRGLGVTLAAFLWTLAWVILDTFARLGARHELMFPAVGGMGVLATLIPLLRSFAVKFGDATPDAALRRRNIVAAMVAFPLFTFLLFGYDVIVHTAFWSGTNVGMWTMLLTLLVAFVLSRANSFLNLTSLNGPYASRLGRTFLGASNEKRIHANPGEGPTEVGTTHPDDDIFYDDYRPEKCGGPLHLISTCVNETVDAMSGRVIDEDKGLTMCVGPAGVSVGRRFHAVWENKGTESCLTDQMILRNVEAAADTLPMTLCPLPVAPDPTAFHVLSTDPLRNDDICAVPEELRLSQWMAISGAAFTPGMGRQTSLPMSLLLGLFNIRLGYWWDSGVATGNRPGRFPPTALRRLGGIPAWLFRTQSRLLAEWWRHFQGPGHRHWYLSDGGHIENSALYELLRRRVRLMIMVDGTHDPTYVFDDLSALVRRARLDFGACFRWVDPQDVPAELPTWIRNWINVSALGTLQSLRREGPHAAALAQVNFDDEPKDSPPYWLVVLKGCLVPEDMPLDLRCYSIQNPQFPNQPTSDQFLTDDQWEAYRVLGEGTGKRIFR